MLDSNSDDAKRLADEIGRLAKEAANLRSDVRRVARMFFKNLDLDGPDKGPGVTVAHPTKNAKEMIARLRLHRASIEDSRGYVRQIEAHLRTIRDKLVTSRTEFEPFMRATSQKETPDDR